MKVYLVTESRWFNYGEHDGDREETYIYSVYSTREKAERKAQILANKAVNYLRNPTDPDEPIDQPIIEIHRDDDASCRVFTITMMDTDRHESRTFYVDKMEVE